MTNDGRRSGRRCAPSPTRSGGIKIVGRGGGGVEKRTQEIKIGIRKREGCRDEEFIT